MDDDGHDDNPYMRLFSDLSDDDEVFTQKPLLAHYTSTSNLESILRNREMWFSNPLFLNDVEELRFGMNEGLNLLLDSTSISNAVKTAARSDIIKSNFQSSFDSFEKSHALDTFVLSFCAHKPDDTDGKLSMWRAYGASGNGACIVFDSSKISPTEDSPLIFAKVHYASRDERISKMKDYILTLSSILEKTQPEDDQLWIAAHYLFERFKLFGLFTKHHGFVEEDEWRVIYLSDRDEKKLLSNMIDYYIGPRGIEPKLKLPIKPISGVTPDDTSLPNLIYSIILGPTTSTPLSKAMASRMLEKLGLSELKDKLKASSIPFRQL